MVDYSRTDIFSFRKTNIGSVAWGFDANNNFDILDALLSEQHNADGSHKNILTDDLTASGVSTFGDVIITGSITMGGGFLIDEIGYLYIKNYMPDDASGNLISYPTQAYFAKNGDVTQPIGLFFDDQVIARSSFADEIDSDYAPKIAVRYASGNKSPFIQVFSENVSNEYEEELALCEKDNYNLVMKKSNKVVFKDSTAYVGEIYRNDNELYIYDSDDIIIESVSQTSVKGYKVAIFGTAGSWLSGTECGAVATVEAFLDSEATVYTYGVTGTTFEDEAKIDVLTPITTIKSSNYTRIRNTAGTTKIDVNNAGDIDLASTVDILATTPIMNITASNYTRIQNTAGTTKIDVDNAGNILMASTVDCKIETPITTITSSNYTRIRNSANTTQINVEDAGDVEIVTATNFETDSAKSVLMASDYVRLRNTAGTTKVQVNNAGDIDLAATVDILASTPIMNITASNYTRIQNTAGTTKVDVNNAGDIDLDATVDITLTAPITNIISSNYTKLRDGTGNSYIKVADGTIEVETDGSVEIFSSSDHIISSDSFEVTAKSDISYDVTGDIIMNCDGSFSVNDLSSTDNLFGITTIGNVSMPKQSCIMAHMASDQSGFTSNDAVTVIYDTVDKDTQGEYDNTTGEITVAEDGTYHIDAYINFGSITATGRLITYIYVNGSSVFAMGHNISTSDGKLGMTGISKDLELNEGDVVTIRGYQRITGNYDTWNTFYELSATSSIVTSLNFRKVM